MPNSLRRFFDRLDAPERSLALLNRSAPTAARDLLAELPVGVEEIQTDGGESDVVALLEDDEVVAKSPLSELLDTVLLVNSDIYKTGARGLSEVSLPTVLARLDEVPFHFRGFPASNKEKFLLIAVSRVIERTAWEHRGGTLRASFQQLSRLNDESGTKQVYRTVAGTETDVHVYGVGDWLPKSLPVTPHTGTSVEYRDSWFVVYRPPPESETGEHVALVALQRAETDWDGFWTFRPEFVRDIDDHIRTTLA